MKLTRPVIRYLGSKWTLAPWIIKHLAPHDVFVSPFGGSASVLLQKSRSKIEVYNDLDERIVNVFKILRDPEKAQALIYQLFLTPWSRKEFELGIEVSDDLVEDARRTIFRSFAGHAGVGTMQRCGFRAKAQLTSYRSASLVWADHYKSLWTAAERLRGVVIECKDAFDVIDQQDGEAVLFYVDPPYFGASSAEDYKHTLTKNAHVRLARVLKSVRGKVVLSGYHSDLYDELYKDWKFVEKESYSDGYNPRMEVLWLCPKTTEDLSNQVKSLGLF